MKTLACIGLVAALGSGALAVEAEARPRPPREFAAPTFLPPGGFLLPDGVFYVRHRGFEAFWADGFYWTMHPRFGWYRAYAWGGPWVLVEPAWVPRRVVVLPHRPAYVGSPGTWYAWTRWERHSRHVPPPERWESPRRPWDPRREDRRDRHGPSPRDRRGR